MKMDLKGELSLIFDRLKRIENRPVPYHQSTLRYEELIRKDIGWIMKRLEKIGEEYDD